MSVYARNMLMLHKQAAEVDPFAKYPDHMQQMVADMFGLGPKAKPYVPNYRECPKCHEKKARVKEVHADTGMDDFELKCDACGQWSDIEHEKSASVDLEQLGHLAEIVLWKKASIAPQDLRYWDDVNNAVAKKISSLTPEEQAQAAVGQVSVLGSCGHPIRHGSNGVTVEIGKECFTCIQANAPLLKAGSILELFGGVELDRSAVVKQDAGNGKRIRKSQEREKYATMATVGMAQRLAPYRQALKELLMGSPSSKAPVAELLKDVPTEVGDVSQLLPNVADLLKLTFSKSAAEMVRKTRLVEQHDDHCPHCDHQFREKGYPRRKHNGESDEEWKAGFDSGDYDEHCPACDGIVDRRELSDDEIESSSWGSVEIQEMLRKQRDNYRKRKASRETTKSASAKCPGCDKEFPEGEPLPDVSMCEVCERYGPSKAAAIAAHIRRARNATHTDPTPAQAHEGNYRKGEFTMHGMTIKLENPQGSTRRGYKDGKEIWSRVMQADYGYFKGTEAVDGDAIDCFIGPNPDSELVIAIDQYRGDSFDETKFVLGVDSQDEGTKLYLAHYPKGWRLGPVSTTTVQQLKEWLKAGKHKLPFKGQLVKAATVWLHRYC